MVLLGWDFILTAVSHILFVEKWKSLEEEGAENMQKKVGLNDMRVYFDMDGTIAKWRDVPVEETRRPGYYADLDQKWNCLILCVMLEVWREYLYSVFILHGYQSAAGKEKVAGQVSAGDRFRALPLCAIRKE